MKTKPKPLSPSAKALYTLLQSMEDPMTFVPSKPEDLSAVQELREKGWLQGAKLLGKSTKAPTTDPRHKPFIDMWVAAYLEVMHVAYAFNGGRDAKAVSLLLPYGTNEELLALARRAWVAPKDQKHWACGQSHSLITFQTQFGKIRNELSGTVRNGEQLKGRVI